MKTTMKIKVMGYRLWVIGMIALLPALAGAVEYKTTYGGIHSRPVYGVATTATNPSTTFQSTSAYSSQWSTENSSTLLNNDGSVNSDAYMTSGSPRVRKGGILPPNPDVDPDDPGNVPLGDAALPLLLLALAYAGARRREREA